MYRHSMNKEKRGGGEETTKQKGSNSLQWKCYLSGIVDPFLNFLGEGGGGGGGGGSERV